MKRNLNDRVRVRLKPKGVEMLLGQWQHCGRNTTPEESLDNVYPGWRDGVIEMHLHDVMHTFGPKLIMGFELPIETEIEFL